MVSSTTRKIFSLAISLLVVVISLTGIALGATAPTVTSPTRYTPGFKGAPGKMARDVAGNFYVADFWGKGIVKVNSQLNQTTFLPTSGRPTAVAVLADNRLVVTMSKPTSKIVFYSQVDGNETVIANTGFNLVAVTLDDSSNIYVLDSGNSISSNYPGDPNFAKVRVYDSNGLFLKEFGARTYANSSPTTTDQFKQPSGIAFESEAKQIVVVDTLNARLRFFSKWNGVSCNFIKTVGSQALKGGTTGGGSEPVVGSAALFYGPVDVAFEYNGTALYRMYVAERSVGEVAVVDAEVAGFGKYLKAVSGATLSGADLKFPTSVLFEKTATGGLLYVASDVTALTAANILKLSVAGGTTPVPGAITLASILATSPSSPINVSGTTNPGGAVSCTVNGAATGTYDGTTSWTGTGLVLNSGNNHIICTSANGGVVEADTYLGTLPQETVAITSPAPDLFTKDGSVIVSGVTGSAGANVKVVNSLGGPVTFVQSDSNKNWSAVVALAEGSDLITATAWKSGVTSDSNPASVTVVADYTPPNMTGTISFLKEAAITNNAVQNIDGIVTDANISRIEINGVPIPSGAMVTLSPTTTYFSGPIILNRGKNTITIKAIDKAKNSTTITRGASVGSEIVLKPEASGITAALPADNSWMNAAAAITASGTADSGINLISFNGAGVDTAPVGGNWSTNAMNATAGFVEYQIDGSGPGLDTVTVKRTINTNASYQQVAITTPAADIATSASSVVIYGNVPANSTIPQIVINDVAAENGTNYVLASGLFDHTVTLVQGLNSVKVISANGTTAVRNIILDNTAPDLGLQADSAPMPTMITGSLEPSASITAVTANPGSVSIPLSKITYDTYDGSGSVVWHANLSGYSYTSVEFTAVDPAGNTSKLSYMKGVPTGDIDGDGSVRLADALAALRHVAGTETIVDANKFFNGDVGGLINGRVARDGVINITDTVLILNKAYGLMNF